MKILREIRLSDVDPSVIEPAEGYPKFRQAVRTVVIDKDNKVGLSFYPPNDHYPLCYFIPGGGVEVDETVEEAAKRETREELGCAIKNIRGLGIIKEYGTNSGLQQDTHVFLADIGGEKNSPQPTDKESVAGLQTSWHPLDEAIKLIQTRENGIPKIRHLTILAEVKKILNLI